MAVIMEIVLLISAALRLDNITCYVSADYTKVWTSMFVTEQSIGEHLEYEFLHQPWKGVGMEWSLFRFFYYITRYLKIEDPENRENVDFE